jgi:hypothetical protein
MINTLHYTMEWFIGGGYCYCCCCWWWLMMNSKIIKTLFAAICFSLFAPGGLQYFKWWRIYHRFNIALLGLRKCVCEYSTVLNCTVVCVCACRFIRRRLIGRRILASMGGMETWFSFLSLVVVGGVVVVSRRTWGRKKRAIMPFNHSHTHHDELSDYVLWFSAMNSGEIIEHHETINESQLPLVFN